MHIQVLSLVYMGTILTLTSVHDYSTTRQQTVVYAWTTSML